MDISWRVRLRMMPEEVAATWIEDSKRKRRRRN